MRVVVLGGGYAGIVAVSGLERRLPTEVELVLVDRRAHHVVRHEIHRVIRRPGFAETIQVPFGDILGRARLRQGTVADIDPSGSSIEFEDGTNLSYDTAAVCFGASPAYYGLDGVREHGIPLGGPADALAIGQGVLDILDAGEGEVVVGGGGLAGIQAAGEIAQARTDAGEPGVAVTLLEQEPMIAPRVEDAFRKQIELALAELNVEIRTGEPVTGATDEDVEMGEQTQLPYDLFVWTGGIDGRSAVGGERPTVRADLRMAGTTFGAGDAVRVIDENGSLAMPSAQTAVRQGRVVASNLESAIRGPQSGTAFRPSYERYRDETVARVVSVGDLAVAQVGPQILTGRPAKALKSTVGVGYLSAAGGIREAISLVREEFGLASPLEGVPFGRS